MHKLTVIVTQPCNAAYNNSTRLTDIPGLLNVTLASLVNTVSSASQELETCAVCKSGNEGYTSRESNNQFDLEREPIIKRVSGMAIYGCVT